MLHSERNGGSGPLVIMLHWLGGSSRTWHEVSGQLATQGFQCVAIDLPGFGQSQPSQAFSIPDMVRSLTETIRHHRADAPDFPWILVGHSMGGKLAMLFASTAVKGDPALAHLHGLVLVSPSPPAPEPMSESKRSETLKSLGPDARDPAKRRIAAEKFVDDNTGKLPLLEAIRERSIEDVLRMDPDALAAWMTTGSKLDCAAQVDILNIPALIMAGTEEKALGPDAQMQHTLPHIPAATLVALEGGGHLAPLERPFEVADRIHEFLNTLDLSPQPVASALTPGFAALIDSTLTSPHTRDVLLQRMHGTDLTGTTLNPGELRTLRALAVCIVPDAGFDLATRIDHALAQPQHDGWRFDALPPDALAWKQGLATLNSASTRQHGVPFIALDQARQTVLLQQTQSGRLGRGLASLIGLVDHDALTAAQMRDWLEDVRSEFAKLYVADPRTLQRIGFTGFADNAGFTEITLESQQQAQP